MVKRNRNPYEDFMAKNPTMFPWGSDDEIQAESKEPPDLGTAALSISPLQQNIAEGSISWVLPSSRLLAGKVLQHCQAVIKRFRLESGGFELVIYKIGITHECSRRFELYQAKGWDQMVVMYQSDELGAVEMLATAKHVVSIAKTFAREDDCKALREMASCPDGDAEKALQRVLKQYDLTLNVPLTQIDCGAPYTVPVLLPEDYIGSLSEKGHLHRLLGGPLYDSAPRLRAFWQRYKAWVPEHEIWTHDFWDPESTVPLLVHGDGGRTYKKDELMVVQFQPVLGWGTRASHPLPNRRAAGVNVQKHCFCTRFLFGVLQKGAYKEAPENFTRFLDVCMQNLSKLYVHGLHLQGKHLRFLVLGVKGTTHYPFEDFGSSPSWLATTGAKNPWPWSVLPPHLEYLPHVRDDPGSFYRFDVMHLYHLGAGRDFCASSLAILLQLYNGTSIPENLAYMTADLRRFLKDTHRQLHFKALTRELLGYKSESCFPTGHWSKAMDTPVMMEFVFWLLQQDQHQTKLGEDKLLRLMASAAHAMGVFMRTLLAAGLWLSRDEAATVSEAGLHFLQCYAKCARICLDRSMCRYNLTPKLHFWHHLCLEIRQGLDRNLDAFLNPLCDSTFADEDFVGRVSRLSRRVSPRLQALRTIGRYLVGTRTQLRQG
ncbi:unnamed protein product [Symbiodinium sp. CCMP2456]|nr:unnamed protein product [Symbiodinium sp. CCMP2456]